MNRVDNLLRTATASLDAAGVPYAVIGGNAVAVWVARCDVGAVRATKDVDILLRREDLDRAAEALGQSGFIRAEVQGIPIFMEADNPLPSLGVHVILASEKVRESSKYAAPDVLAVERVSSGFFVLNLLELVQMKLVANRRHDQVHLEDLLRVGLIDATLAARLPEDLLDRLRHVRDTMEWFAEPPRF